MSEASMTLHCGAREVTPEQLALIPCPPPEGRWRPVPHKDVLDYALGALGDAGYEVEQMKLGLSRTDARFWGTLVLKNNVATGVSLAVAIASSTDQSTSMRWAYGHRVWVCDNGAWSAEKTIAKRHTTHGVERYREAIVRCVGELETYREVEAKRIRTMRERIIDDHFAESMLLRLYQDEGILSPRTLPTALDQFREPKFDWGDEKSVWRLYNAVTFAIQSRAQSAPQAHLAATMRLSAVLAVPAEPAEAHDVQACD